MPPTLRICRTRCDDRRAQYSVEQVPVHDDLDEQAHQTARLHAALAGFGVQAPKDVVGDFEGGTIDGRTQPQRDAQLTTFHANGLCGPAQCPADADAIMIITYHLPDGWYVFI